MSNVVVEPTPSVLRAASVVYDYVGEFLAARRSVPVIEEFESGLEAVNLMSLSIRSIESICELSKTDLVLVPAANVLSRSAFETAVKAAWMVDPSDWYEREVRWLAHLQEEERQHDRLAMRIKQQGGDAAFSENRRDSIRKFRIGVTERLPAGYAALPGNPSVEQMLDTVGCKDMYWVYTRQSSYVHGGHGSTWLYRKNLGVAKVLGEFVDCGNWLVPMWTAWMTIRTFGSHVLDRLGASQALSTNDAAIKAALARMVAEAQHLE